MKTLVVDDELVSRNKLQRIMESFGECEMADNGVAAIDVFKRAREEGEPFDLIALDIAMPVMDGTEVLLEIREIEENDTDSPTQKPVTIMMVTAHSGRDHIYTCVQAGCDDFIVKPFDKETIVKKLEKMDLL